MLMSGPNSTMVLQPTTEVTLRHTEGPDTIFRELSVLQRESIKTKWWKTFRDLISSSCGTAYTITDHSGKKDGKTYNMDLSASLPDELNAFYARFEDSNTLPVVKLPAGNNSCSLTFSLPDVTRSLRAVNPRKAPGHDGVHGGVLRSCANQLAEVLKDIFSLSLRLSAIPTCFKKTTIVPVPKKSVVTCLNDY